MTTPYGADPLPPVPGTHEAAPAPPQLSGWYPSAYAPPQRPTSSVSGLGVAVQILLIVQLVAAFVLLFPVLHERSLVDKLRADPTSVTLADAKHADDVVSAVNGIVALLFIATGIVWLIWFFRARRNAGIWSPVYQRRGEGWAIGAWFCPIVNLWFPYMIAKDILDGTEREDQAWAARPRRPLLMGWWLSLILLYMFTLSERGQGDPKSLHDLTTDIDIDIAGILVRLLAGVLAILVVNRITQAQTRRRATEAS